MPTGSWIVVDRLTGRSVLETFSKRVVQAVNRDKYEVLEAGDYLGRMNQQIKSAN